MDPEELNRRLDEMWERVHSGDAPSPVSGEALTSPPTSPPPSSQLLAGEFSRQTELETVRILKRQHLDKELYYRELLAAREREVEGMRGRLKEAEERVESLRRSLSDREEEALAMTVQAQAWAEDQTRAINSLKDAHKQETDLLKAAADELRDKLKAEAAHRGKLAAEWKRHEADLLAQIKTLEDLPAKLRADLRRREAELNQTRDELDKIRKDSGATASELQQAVTKTTEELLRERAAHKELDETKAKLTAELDLLKDTHERMKSAWAEERKQWSELWERERSTWEAQRQEMRQWEEDLRKQREDWLRSMGGATLGSVVRPAGTSGPTASTAARIPRPIENMNLWRGVGLFAAVAAVIIGGLYGYRTLSLKVWLKHEASARIPVTKATSLAWDGSKLWVGAWEGKLYGFDPASPGAPSFQTAPKGLGPFRPAGIAVADGALWTLDAAQVRVLKQDPRNPSKVFWRTGDGAFPTAIAHDGRRLWIYEGDDQHLYRYRQDPQLGPEESFSLAPGLVATSMQWSGKDLWLFDSLSCELWRFRLQGAGFTLKSRQKLEPGTVAVAVVDRHVWTVSPEGDKSVLKRFVRRFP